MGMFDWEKPSASADETSSELDFSSSADSHNYASMGSGSSANADYELQQVIAQEQQKAAFHAQVRNLTDICWELCVDKPASRFDSRTETCISNCTDRFIDTTLTITNRFAQLLQQRGGF